jgi:hypothetical protein
VRQPPIRPCSATSIWRAAYRGCHALTHPHSTSRAPWRCAHPFGHSAAGLLVRSPESGEPIALLVLAEGLGVAYAPHVPRYADRTVSPLLALAVARARIRSGAALPAPPACSTAGLFVRLSALAVRLGAAPAAGGSGITCAVTSRTPYRPRAWAGPGAARIRSGVVSPVWVCLGCCFWLCRGNGTGPTVPFLLIGVVGPVDAKVPFNAERPHKPLWGVCVVFPYMFMSGGVLLSHTVPGAVPSALEGLTSGFGMGPGVSPPL